MLRTAICERDLLALLRLPGADGAGTSPAARPARTPGTSGVGFRLEHADGTVVTGRTDADGRIMGRGVHRLVFDTGDHAFFPRSR